LNLFLHITGRRDDGYHDLQTAFQLLDYGDTLSIAVGAGNGEVELVGDLKELAPQENLIWRAASLLQDRSGCRQSASIELTKRLPLGGGLGGGSSNAATTLVALNHLWQCGFNTDQLAELGRELGADVPVFVRGLSAWGEGIGDKLAPLALAENWFVVLQPGVHVETAKLFSNPQLTRNSTPITIAGFRAGERTRNVFEPLVCKLWPEVDQARQALDTCRPEHAAPARLTGSGACVFAQLGSENEAQYVLSSLQDRWVGFVARGVNQSPLLDALRRHQGQ
jgi:4-diphosphocytidyl-2-C-methyl-D-erythritol kinase